MPKLLSPLPHDFRVRPSGFWVRDEVFQFVARKLNSPFLRRTRPIRKHRMFDLPREHAIGFVERPFPPMGEISDYGRFVLLRSGLRAITLRKFCLPGGCNVQRVDAIRKKNEEPCRLGSKLRGACSVWPHIVGRNESPNPLYVFGRLGYRSSNQSAPKNQRRCESDKRDMSSHGVPPFRWLAPGARICTGA